MRIQIFAFVLALGPAALLFSACKAEVKPGCVGGENCTFDGFDPPPVEGTGGGGGGGGGLPPLPMCSPGPATGDFPCDVFEVIHRRCHKCHGDPATLIGPFSIYSYEDTQKLYGNDPIFTAMTKATRPTSPGATPFMPLDGPLNEQDAKVLGDWLDMCAPPVADGMGCECPSGMGCTPLP